MKINLKYFFKFFFSLLIVIVVFVFYLCFLNSEAQLLYADDIIKDGDLIRARSDHKVYIVKHIGDKKYKRHLTDPFIFNLYEHLTVYNIKNVPSVDLDLYQESRLIKATDDYRVFEVDQDGVKHWLNMTSEEFSDAGYQWDLVFTVNDLELSFYSTGSDITGPSVVNIRRFYQYCWEFDCSSSLRPRPKLDVLQIPSSVSIDKSQFLQAEGDIKIAVFFLYGYESLPDEKLNILKGSEADIRSFNFAAKWFEDQAKIRNVDLNIALDFFGQTKVSDEYVINSYEDSTGKDLVKFVKDTFPETEDYDVIVPFYYSSNDISFVNHASPGERWFKVFSKKWGDGLFYPSFEPDETIYSETFAHELAHIFGVNDHYNTSMKSACSIDISYYDVMCHRVPEYDGDGNVIGYFGPLLVDLIVDDITAKEIGWYDIDGDGILEIYDSCPFDKDNKCSKQTIANFYNICWDYDCTSSILPRPKLAESEKPLNVAVDDSKFLPARGNIDILVAFLYGYDSMPEENIDILKNEAADIRSFKYAAKWFENRAAQHRINLDINVAFTEQTKVSDAYIIDNLEDALSADLVKFVKDTFPEAANYDVIVPFYYSSNDISFQTYSQSSEKAFIMFSKKWGDELFYPSFEYYSHYSEIFAHELAHIFGATDKYTDYIGEGQPQVGCWIEPSIVEYDIMCHRVAEYNDYGEVGFITPLLEELLVTSFTAKEIGWYDIDGDGVLEVVDACPYDLLNTCF